MLYFYFFLPIVPVMLYAIYGTWRRGEYQQVATLTLVSSVILIRFFTMALDFSGYDIPFLVHFLEMSSSLYIIPTMYMYLCGQCGIKWNNMVAAFLLLLPFCVHINMENVNIGRHSIVIIQSCVVGFRMLVLWRRIRAYGLKFTKWLSAFYVWMFFMLGGMIVTHALAFDTSRVAINHQLHFIGFGLIIIVAYLIVPGMFNVAPVVSEENDKPVELKKFLEQNQRLVKHLHQLMEEDRIYLQCGICIDDVAELMGTNRSYVTRLMRAEYDQSFAEYVSNARIIYSKKLLLTSSMTLEEIANAVGFSSAAVYCRVFRRITNTTPSAWRNEQ